MISKKIISRHISGFLPYSALTEFKEKLLPHNREAFEAVMDRFNDAEASNRTYFVQPTGTGKTFVDIGVVTEMILKKIDEIHQSVAGTGTFAVSSSDTYGFVYAIDLARKLGDESADTIADIVRRLDCSEFAKTLNDKQLRELTGVYVGAVADIKLPHVAVVAPNNAIFNEFQKHNIPFIDYKSYAWFLGHSREEYEEKYGDYNLVVADEFHHLGAKKWGDKFTEFIESNPDAKFLGSTATHKRYLENGRDMGVEVFGTDGKAHELTLYEAWERKILIAPKYLIGVSDETINSIRNEVEKAKAMKGGNMQARKKAIAKFEKGFAALQKKDISVLIKENLYEDTKRLVVFCNSIDEIDEKKAAMEKALKENGYEMAPYVVHSKNKKAAEKSLADFAEDNFDQVFETDKGVKVVFSVDMLNEGVHVPKVDGVVMFNRTMSANKILQQMGRAYSAKQHENRRPLIFDMTINIANYVDVVGKGILKYIFPPSENPKANGSVHPHDDSDGRTAGMKGPFPRRGRDNGHDDGPDLSNLPKLGDGMIDIVNLMREFQSDINDSKKTEEELRRQEAENKAREERANKAQKSVVEYILKEKRLPDAKRRTQNKYFNDFYFLDNSNHPKAMEIRKNVERLCNAVIAGDKIFHMTGLDCHGFTGEMNMTGDKLIFPCSNVGKAGIYGISNKGYVAYDEKDNSYELHVLDPEDGDILLGTFADEHFRMGKYVYSIVGEEKRNAYVSINGFIKDILETENPSVERFDISFKKDNLVEVAFCDQNGKRQAKEYETFFDGVILSEQPVVVYLKDKKGVFTVDTSIDVVRGCNSRESLSKFINQYIDNKAHMATEAKSEIEISAWEHMMKYNFGANKFLPGHEIYNGTCIVKDKNHNIYNLSMLRNGFLCVQPVAGNDSLTGYVYCPDTRLLSKGKDKELIMQICDIRDPATLDTIAAGITPQTDMNITMALIKNINLGDEARDRLSRLNYPRQSYAEIHAAQVIKNECNVVRLRKKYGISAINRANIFIPQAFEKFQKYTKATSPDKTYELGYDGDFFFCNKSTGSVYYLGRNVKFDNDKNISHIGLLICSDHLKTQPVAEFSPSEEPPLKYFKPELRMTKL